MLSIVSIFTIITITFVVLWSGNSDSQSRTVVDFQPGQNLIPNITIYGAVITVAPELRFVDPANVSIIDYPNKRMTLLRLENIYNLSAELPFDLEYWPSVRVGPCPYGRHHVKTERGVALAHYQIWRDFIYFDEEALYNSSLIINELGESFLASSSDHRVKNGIPFRDDDILVIFEDDAESTIVDTNTTLLEELSDMKVDLLYLGWCEGRLARPVPLCTQAYAVTRRGARKLVDFYEPCGRGIDEQMVKFAKNGWITYRSAHGYSYNKNRKPNFPQPGDKTFGIFHQRKKLIPSINGH